MDAGSVVPVVVLADINSGARDYEGFRASGTFLSHHHDVIGGPAGTHARRRTLPEAAESSRPSRRPLSARQARGTTYPACSMTGERGARISSDTAMI